MVERLKQEGTSYSSICPASHRSSSVEDLCKDGGQLVTTGFQTGWCDATRHVNCSALTRHNAWIDSLYTGPVHAYRGTRQSPRVITP